jgi:predicted nucleic acid-binding protein
MIVVSDSTPLIALAKVNHFSLLRLLFREIIIPQSVYDEVAIAGKGRPGSQELASADWVKVEQIQDRESAEQLMKENEQLSRADAEAIILSKEKRADFLLVDDAELREVAQRELAHTEVSYTASLLIIAKEEGLIAYVRGSLDEMRQKGVWIEDSIYEQILEQAGEIIE